MADDAKKEVMRILIVDDDKEFATALKELLEDEGFDAWNVAKGAEALDLLRERYFDAIFVDALLPAMDGFSLCKEIRLTANTDSVHLIMISGVYKASNHEAEATSKYRLSAYLEKPVAEEQVIALLRKLFKSKYPKSITRPMAKATEGNKKSTAKTTSSNRTFRFVNTYFLYDPSRIALIGKTSEVPLPVLFSQIQERKLTGHLLVVWKKAKKALTIVKGNIVAIQSNIINECLGQLLLKEGTIDQETLDKSLGLMKETGKSQGEMLLRMGVMTSLQLTESIKRQFETKLFNTFPWTDASYSFKVKDEIPKHPSFVETSTLRLIRRGITEFVPERTLEAWLRPYLSSPLTAAEDCELRMQNAGFNLKEIRFAKGLEGDRFLEDVITGHFRKPAEMRRMMLTLIVIRAVHLEQPTRYEAPETTKGGTKTGSYIGVRENVLASQAQALLTGQTGSLSEEEKQNRARQDEQEKMTMLKAAQGMEEEPRKLFQNLFIQRRKLRNMTYFEIFGATRDAPYEEIKKAYLKMAKSMHPDSVPHGNVVEIRQLADEIFSLVTKAHETLMDKEKRKEYTEVLEGGGNVDATGEVAKILASEQHFHDGKVAMRRKDWLKAKQSFQNAIKLNPKEGEFYSELGWASYNMKPNDSVIKEEAVKYLEKAIEMSPKLADAHHYLAMIYKTEGKLNKAVEYFQRTLQLDPRHARAKSEMNLIKMRQKQKGKVDKMGFLSRFKK